LVAGAAVLVFAFAIVLVPFACVAPLLAITYMAGKCGKIKAKLKEFKIFIAALRHVWMLRCSKMRRGKKKKIMILTVEETIGLTDSVNQSLVNF